MKKIFIGLAVMALFLAPFSRPAYALTTEQQIVLLKIQILQLQLQIAQILERMNTQIPVSVGAPTEPKIVVEQIVEQKEQIKSNCTIESKVTYMVNGNNIETEVKWDSVGISESGTIYRSRAMGGSGGEYVPLYNGNITFEVYPIPKKHLLALPTATTSLSYYPYFKLAYPDGTVCYAKSAPIQ